MDRRLKGVLIETALWLTFAGIAYGLSFQFDGSFPDYRYGAAGWPRSFILIFVVCVLGLFATSLAELRCKEEPQKKLEKIATNWKEKLILFGNFVIPIGYIFLLPRTGFFLTTPFFIVGYMYMLGERRLVHLLGSAALIYALCLLIFTKLLYMPLPVGNWSGFYDINTALLSIIR